MEFRLALQTRPQLLVPILSLSLSLSLSLFLCLSFIPSCSSALQVPLILIHRDRCAKETSDRPRKGGRNEGRGGGEKRVLLNTNATGMGRDSRLVTTTVAPLPSPPRPLHSAPQQLGGSPRVRTSAVKMRLARARPSVREKELAQVGNQLASRLATPTATVRFVGKEGFLEEQC